MRKIIQISESLTAGNYDIHYSLSALCDDGTVWVYYPGNKEWGKLPDIPQDDEQGNGQDESV